MPPIHTLAFVLSLAAASILAPAAASDTACADCISPYREYTVEPDARVRALFEAAAAADEAGFERLVEGLAPVDMLAIETRSLTAAILSPSPALVAVAREGDRDIDRATEILLRERHHLTLSTRARMLEEALDAGASVSDIGRHSRIPPLHRATVFGNAHIVRILLEHGADPGQRDGENGKDPIEFALDHAFFVRMSGLPELVEPAERGRMIEALLQGGAPLPWSWMEAVPGLERVDGRPMADRLLWPKLAALTEGGAVMQALADAGTRPAESTLQASALAYAVRAGNTGGAEWLLANAPRHVEESPYGARVTTDSWTDAAMWAIHEPDPDLRQALLEVLLHADLDWDARGPQDHSSPIDSAPLRADPDDVPGNTTLLGHALVRGDGGLVERLIALGAPVNPGPDVYGPSTPLGQAVLAQRPEMVELVLRHGADPLAGSRLENAPLYMAIRPVPSPGQDDGDAGQQASRRRDALQSMLAALGPERLRALDVPAPSQPLRQALSAWSPDPGTVELLLDAGFSPANVVGVSPEVVFATLPAALVVRMVEGGLPLHTEWGDGGSTSPLVPALHAAEPSPLVRALLERGVDPDARDALGHSPLDYAIRLGSLPMVELLVAAGADPAPADAAVLAALVMDDSHRKLRDWVARHGRLSLPQYCPDAKQLGWLLTIDDASWQRMRDAGLAQNAGACAARGASWRSLAMSGLRALGFPLGGWMAEAAASRIATLPVSELDPLMAATPGEAFATLFADVQPVALPSGPPAGRIDPARAGRYVVASGHEAGSQLVLHADGRFEHTLSSAAPDAHSTGQWRVLADKVLLRGTPASSDAAPPLRLRAVDVAGYAPGAPFSVLLAIGGQQVHDGRLAVYGEHGRFAAGHYGSVMEAEPFEGPVLHIAVQHDGVADGRSFVLEPVADERQHRHFVVEIDEAAAQLPLRLDLGINGDTLDHPAGGPGYQRR